MIAGNAFAIGRLNPTRSRSLKTVTSLNKELDSLISLFLSDNSIWGQ